MIGDADRVYLPDLGRARGGERRFRGVRLVRTNLRGDRRQVEMTRDDLSDLSALQLDMVITVAVAAGGLPGRCAWAHLLPPNPEGELHRTESVQNPAELDAALDFVEFIADLEGEYQKKRTRQSATGGDPAILVYVALPGARDEQVELDEMRELCRTAGVDLIDRVVQRRAALHARYAVGRGKIEDLAQRAIQLDADLLIFGQDLEPGMMRAITDVTDLRVLDRTQVILDIFAQHANARDAKLQVELAQLKYNLPRLSDRNTGMSRLAGGIGGRGPGETKLEINRRRARDRIAKLESELKRIGAQRGLRRGGRRRAGAPIVSIVGYTNAGKSTLLNRMTSAAVLSEDKLFATLRPTSRQLWVGHGAPLAVLTDTVGFIHELPPELISAFKATLEELDDAQLLIHLVDASDDEFEERITAVERILDELELGEIERLLVVNKADLIADGAATTIAHRLGGLAVSAQTGEGIDDLRRAIERRLIAARQKRGARRSEEE